tara:strand:+ start:2902 stop:4116 length:1215 start_codon:yes stop_codon:yes gene_type:complete
MANTIKQKRGTTDPGASDLVVGELAINTTDGGVFTKTDGGTVVEVGSGGGGGGLSEFVESQETASPNDTKYVDALTATDSTQTNLDVAFVAKGTGATLAQVPDAAAAGGDKRGSYATDFQKLRGNANQVASAGYSVICGGVNNKVTGPYSSIVGGKNCVAGTGYYSLAGGENTSASGFHSICHGYATSTSGSRTGSVGGYAGNTSGTDAGRLAGYYCQPSGTQSATIAGSYHIANSQNSVVIGGQRGHTRSTVGKVVIPGSKIPIQDKAGVTQLGLLLLGAQTTDATATTLRSNSNSASSTNQVKLDNNTAYYFKGNVIAGVTGAGNTRAWTFEGAIKRGASASTTALVGTVIKNDIAYDSGAADWDVAITADTSNGCLKLVVTGQASTTIRWVAKVETTEMGF